MQYKDFSHVKIGYLIRLKGIGGTYINGYVIALTKKYVILSNKPVRTQSGAFREPGFWDKLPGEKREKVKVEQVDGIAILERYDK